MCEHLIHLEQEIKARGLKETYRGQPWSNNCREWVYFDCLLVKEKIEARYNFPSFVSWHSNDDERSGLEAGFVCYHCYDAVIGAHPRRAEGKIRIE